MGKRSKQRRKAKEKREAPAAAEAKEDYPAAAKAKKDYPAAAKEDYQATAANNKGYPASNPKPSTSTLKPLKNIKKRDKNEGSYSKKKDEKVFGFIFMCNSKTKPECYKNRVFGMSKRKVEMIKKIQPGTRLFLYDYDVKLLYGIYKAKSRGGMNLVDHAFDGNYPAQVRFSVEKDCQPIHESKLKQAILENYVSTNIFHPELSRKQVTKLMSLFKPVTTAPEPSPEPASPHYIHDTHAPPPAHLPPLDLHVPPPPMQLTPHGTHVPLPMQLTPPDMHVPPPLQLIPRDMHVPPPMHLSPRPDPYVSRWLPTPAYLPPPHLPPVEELYKPTRLPLEDPYHARAANHGPTSLNDPYHTSGYAPAPVSVSRNSDASLYRPTRLPLEDPYLARAANHGPKSLNDPYFSSGYAHAPVSVSRPFDASLSVNDRYYRAGHFASDLNRSVEHHARVSEPVSRYVDSSYPSTSYPYNQAEPSRDYYAQNPTRLDSHSHRHRVPSETIFNSNASFSDIARDYQFTTTSLNLNMI